MMALNRRDTKKMPQQTGRPRKPGLWSKLLGGASTTMDAAPFFDAVEKGDLERVKSLLTRFPKLASIKESGERRGGTALHNAALQGNAEIVKLLLASNADVNAPDATLSHTPLYKAVARGKEEVVNLLLDHGADVNVKAYAGQTSFFLACEIGYKDVASLLLAHGADVNAKDDKSRTPLHEATHNICKRSHAELDILEKANKKYDIFPSYKDLDISGKSYNDLVAWLLTCGADVRAKDNNGKTPLHEIADQFHLRELLKSVAELFLVHGADVNAKDNVSETPLHRAAYWGLKDVAGVLLAHGAHVNSRTSAGETPLDLCAKRENSLFHDIYTKSVSTSPINPSYETERYHALLDTCELLSKNGGSSESRIWRRIH
jgi:ankyrin repeat protein